MPLWIQIGNRNQYKLLDFFFNRYSWGFRTSLYFFLCSICESGQTITLSRNLFRLDFYHRNTSALSVSHHKRKLEAGVASCSSSYSVFKFCLLLFGNERINGCLLKTFSISFVLAYLLKGKNCPALSVH